MKFSCANTDFLEAVSTASKASSASTSFPVLEMLLIEADEGIKITGNNLEIAVEYYIPATVYEKGSISVNAKIICEIIRRMPEGIIFFEVGSDSNVKITCGELDFTIIGISPEDFPKIPDIDVSQNIVTTGEVISNIVKKTSFAVAQTDSKPILTGIKIDVKEDVIKAVAIDGYRMAISYTKNENTMPETGFIIPGRSLIEFSRISGGTKDKVIINISDKNVLFEYGNCRFLSRLLDGEFINYENILPKSHNYSAVIDAAEFIKSVDRAALLADAEGNKTPVRVLYEADKVTVMCNTGKGNMKDIIAVKTDSTESFEVGYNCKFLMDALKATDCDKIKIEIVGSVNPTVIKPSEDDEAFTFIVLPVRLK